MHRSENPETMMNSGDQGHIELSGVGEDKIAPFRHLFCGVCVCGYMTKNINPGGESRENINSEECDGSYLGGKIKESWKTKRNPKQEKGKGGGERKRERKRNVRKRGRERALSLCISETNLLLGDGVVCFCFPFLLSRQESLKIQSTL